MSAALADSVAPGATLSRAPAIEMRGLTKRYGPTEIIRGVDLTIPRGERHAIIGPNGAGKSTLFNVVSGLIVPSVGEVRLDGKTISGLPAYKITRF